MFFVSGFPILYVVGAASGASVLVTAVLLFIGWRFCRKKNHKNFLQKWSTVDGSSPESVLEKNLKISKSTPDLQEEHVDPPAALTKRFMFRFPFRQSTLPTVSQRHIQFQRQLSHKLDLSNIEFTVQSVKHKEQPTMGCIKPELYKQSSIDSIKSEHIICGRFSFSLLYDHQMEALVVFVQRAEDIPAKDFSGTSDPYVKIYLLPDRKNKYQTKVHRKTLNPEFEEKFVFNVPYREIPNRILQFNIYDFDRFSRHDLIGSVVVKDVLWEGNLCKETFFVRDILSCHQEKVDLGEVMFSLCYLPTAGRLTLTAVKARNLKAMDITGSSDPFVKVSLMCQGKRIKKKKTSVKKNTLNPVYNEAMVFDVPQENVDEIYLIIKMIDYDRIGSNEVMGCCAVGPQFGGDSRDHWFEMLENPRKPVAQWYSLLEHLPQMTTDESCQGRPGKRIRQWTMESSDGGSGF